MKDRSRYFIFAIMAVSLCQSASSFARQNSPQLELNRPVESEIRADEIHAHRLRLAAGQFAHLGVAGEGISPGVTIFAPNGKRLVEMGRLSNPFGVAPLRLVADASDDYRFEVRSLDKTAGRYRLTVVALREATLEDRSRAAAAPQPQPRSWKPNYYASAGERKIC